MKYSILGNTDLKVSRVCLGTMTWGEQNTEPQAHDQLAMAVAAGVNFIDSAELYPVPSRDQTLGLTEQYTGTWLRRSGQRDQLIIASKVCGRADWTPHIRGGKARLDRTNIQAALEATLKRLQTDYLDLYQVHWPDRDANYFGRLGYPEPADDADDTPIEETLSVLNDLVRAGKVRHIGISNETPWGAMQYLQLAEQRDWPRCVSIQNPYSLLNRTFEVGLAEIAHREAVGLLAYSPLGFGALSGKYLGGAEPTNARLSLFKSFGRYTNEEGIRATEAYVALAKEHGLDPCRMALAYVHSRPFLTSTIIGATDLAQLESNLASIDLQLSEEVLEAIEAIHTRIPNPCP